MTDPTFESIPDCYTDFPHAKAPNRCDTCDIELKNQCKLVATNKSKDSQQPIGFPCKNLIFDKDGYPRCAAMPMKDPKTGAPTFATCSAVWVLALGDLSNFCEGDAEKQCPEKYSWNQMRAKLVLPLKKAGIQI